MSTPNVPLIREVAGWIRAQAEFGETVFDRHEQVRKNPAQAPDSEFVWDQDSWVDTVYGAECKTACCVAAYVTLKDPRVDVKRTREAFAIVLNDGSTPRTTFHAHAQDLLGLTDRQAMRLFYTGNDPDEVLALLSEFAGEEL